METLIFLSAIGYICYFIYQLIVGPLTLWQMVLAFITLLLILFRNGPAQGFRDAVYDQVKELLLYQEEEPSGLRYVIVLLAIFLMFLFWFI